MIKKIEELQEKFFTKIKNTDSLPAIAELKAQFIGKKGQLNEILKGLHKLKNQDKRRIGERANTLKQEIQAAITKHTKNLERQIIDKKLTETYIDRSLSNGIIEQYRSLGTVHPVSKIQAELEDIFISMGFEILDGPHIEDDYHNFEALNFPAFHPAREMQDTFWFNSVQLLRTHTSNIQVRGLETHKPPLAFVAPGKVFRCEATDASHEAVFHQMEGMFIAKDVSVANLIYFMKTLLKEVFEQDMQIRLRPGYFPFVEPGFELDIQCLICGGSGCSVCKKTGWVELLPCGMVHPNVLKHANISPREYNGFAFGLGLDRLVMMRYQIDDIRYLHSGNLLFLEQFN